jgi:hypothetical protein
MNKVTDNQFAFIEVQVKIGSRQNTGDEKYGD